MTSNDEIYLIDSNAFITPHRMYYQFSFAPTFWEQLNRFSTAGKIMTLDKVGQELCRESAPEKKDDMQVWYEDTFTGSKIPSTNQEVVKKYVQVMNHLQEDNKYNEKALREWSDAKVADAWLIAVALQFGYTIISFEKKVNIQPNTSIGRAKIPNICEDLGVKYCDLFEMMKKLGFKL